MDEKTIKCIIDKNVCQSSGYIDVGKICDTIMQIHNAEIAAEKSWYFSLRQQITGVNDSVEHYYTHLVARRKLHTETRKKLADAEKRIKELELQLLKAT